MATPRRPRSRHTNAVPPAPSVSPTPEASNNAGRIRYSKGTYSPGMFAPVVRPLLRLPK
eukprot:CAMPEP_0172536900 /NCGR_PEP_ID=MMETSP1067-20121228/8622_1 /TAXON_ID=265564 ORGANISM="Thalassiosira punctigera, Strain Tpunct2005C2" /NCGR_SAMPLE_ID=MMETSP1067 /ASSEMBLY_ACC=CAM_ASM_000444 /LENGTH=58 /DNA_ID=CAMNT_0013322087 /DNA_START=24 /DNA_END=197 /DNA_ORIENTATION=-